MTRLNVGLQPERTELAWRRTCLALTTGSLIAIRHVLDALDDPAWVVVGVAGLLVGGWLWGAARQRSHRFAAALSSTSREPGQVPDGCLPLILTGTVVVAGVFGWVVIAAWSFSPA